MINTKGEWIYTNAEIAYELGLSPATINAIGKSSMETRFLTGLLLRYAESLSISNPLLLRRTKNACKCSEILSQKWDIQSKTMKK